MTPPPFPRIPYLVAPDHGADDDQVVSAEERRAVLEADCVVEEKLDGANVCIWLDSGAIRVASRGGPDAMDRGGQLGRLRGWVAENDHKLRPLLVAPVTALYGEWLWRTHTVHYTALPDLLVVLDLRHERGWFLPPAVRDLRCKANGLTHPPRLFHGPAATMARLEGLCVASAFGAEKAEGVVARPFLDDPSVPRVKMLAPGFRRLTDEEWDRRGLALNAVGAR